MAQNVDIPLTFLRADLVDSTKPRDWMYVYSPSVTAVNGYYRSRESAREAAIHKLAADIESHYKAAAADPSVYYSYTTSWATGPNSEIIFKAVTAGTAESAVTVAIVADSAATAVLTTATSAGAVSITAMADSASVITSTANDVIAAVNADTGTTAHAAHWVTAALTGKSDGKGLVSLLTAKTLVNEIQIHRAPDAMLTLTVGMGRK